MATSKKTTSADTPKSGKAKSVKTDDKNTEKPRTTSREVLTPEEKARKAKLKESVPDCS